MAVFLRTHVITCIHILGRSLVEVDEVACTAVNVVLAGTAAEVFHTVHVGRQTEAHAYSRNHKLRSRLTGLSLSGGECGGESSLGSLHGSGLHIGGAESVVGLHASVGTDGVGCDIEVTGGKQIVGGKHHVIAFMPGCHVDHLEIAARLLPHLLAQRSAVAVVVVGGSAPEIGLDTEAVLEIFGASNIIRCHHARCFVKHKLHRGRFHNHVVARLLYGKLASLAHMCGRGQRLHGELELLGGYHVSGGDERSGLHCHHIESDEIFSLGLGLKAAHVHLELA